VPPGGHLWRLDRLRETAAPTAAGLGQSKKKEFFIFDQAS
jgi:hypothetical protein